MTRHTALLLAWLPLAACGPSGNGEPPRARPEATAPAARAAAAERPDSAAEATRLFAARCTTCHGESGAGDGPGSAGLDPAPRDFRDPQWQASVSDAHLEQIVLYGGAAVGRSPTMPGNPDLMARPEVVAALVAHIRALRRP